MTSASFGSTLDRCRSAALHPGQVFRAITSIMVVRQYSQRRKTRAHRVWQLRGICFTIDVSDQKEPMQMRPPLKLSAIDQEHLQELYDASGVARDELPYTDSFEELSQGFQDRTFKNAE